MSLYQSRYDPGAGILVAPQEASHARSLAEHFGNFYEPEDFGAVGDGKADDTVAFERWFGASEAVTGGLPLRLRRGAIYRVTRTLDFTNATQPVVVIGPGSRSVAFYGDFADPGNGIVDISFSTNGARIQGHVLENFAVFANGVVGDPIAIVAKRAQQAKIVDLYVPGDGHSLLGATRQHLNTSLFMTQVNNCEVNRCDFFGGYQPVPNDIGTTARFSSAGTTLTATEAVFTSAMVGKDIIFDQGDDSSDSTNFFYTTIASFTSSTEVELTDAPPTALSGAQASIDYVTGSMTASDATLTLNVDVLTQAHVGMRIYIPLAHTKTDAGNTEGVLCTTIASVTNGTTAELSDTPDVNVSNQPILFGPAVFIGTPAEEEGESRQTNDCVLQQVQIEGYQGAGILVNQAIALYLDNCKLHGESTNAAPNKFGRSMYAAVLSEIKNVEIRATPLSFSWMARPNLSGQVWMQGSRGQLILDGFETLGLFADAPVVRMSAENTATARVVIGPGWITDGLDKHAAGWRPVIVGAGRAYFGGRINERLGVKTFAPLRGDLREVEVLQLSSNQVVNNSTTLVDVPDMQFWLSPSEEVEFRYTLFFNGPAAGDIKFAVVVPSGATLRWSFAGGLKLDTALAPAAATAVNVSGTSDDYGVDGSIRCAVIIGTVLNGATAGLAKLQFAQAAPSGSNTQIVSNATYVEVMRR